MKNSEKPAFPIFNKDGVTINESQLEFGKDKNGALGLTKREIFAIMAMQGLLANSERLLTFKEVAKQAIENTDELLSLLNQ